MVFDHFVGLALKGLKVKKRLKTNFKKDSHKREQNSKSTWVIIQMLLNLLRRHRIQNIEQENE